MKNATLASITILGMILTGCASNQQIDAATDIDREVVVQGPQGPDGKLRRVVGVSQAAILYSRSIYLDPINRPISNAASLFSFTLKSVSGFFRRLSVNNEAAFDYAQLG